jgi:hypothetical protein
VVVSGDSSGDDNGGRTCLLQLAQLVFLLFVLPFVCKVPHLMMTPFTGLIEVCWRFRLLYFDD